MNGDDPFLALAASLPEKKVNRKRKKYRIVCGRCGSLMNLFGSLYICSKPKCNGKHLAHPNGKPTGIPCNRSTAKARIKAHKALDRIWQSGRVTRQQAYVILKRIMGMTIEEAHIGRFTKEQCYHLIKRLDELGTEVFASPYTDSFA